MYSGLTQNYGKTNHEGHEGHEVKKVSESSCVSPNINEISWETEVWVAEAPTHIIHFNCERFLGPY
ncbi:BsuBI/PstI family type II restriction endonuclease [Nodularia spumigena]|uniref:BsuBI/PstI family type II restriction endonuclease n=1 Tax=Nodularia spumigena TaxID=70799 RepID=UPI000D2F70D5